MDSSPQGGKNLLNSEYDLIAADNMLRLGDVFLAIRETLQVLHAGDMSGSEEQEFLDEQDALLEQGQSMIYHHFNIPVVLAQDFGSSGREDGPAQPGLNPGSNNPGSG